MKKTFCLVLITILILVFSLSTFGLAQSEKQLVTLDNGQTIYISVNSNHCSEEFSTSSSRSCPIEVPGS